jgi:hypothetical protein
MVEKRGEGAWGFMSWRLNKHSLGGVGGSWAWHLWRSWWQMWLFCLGGVFKVRWEDEEMSGKMVLRRRLGWIVSARECGNKGTCSEALQIFLKINFAGRDWWPVHDLYIIRYHPTSLESSGVSFYTRIFHPFPSPFLSIPACALIYEAWDHNQPAVCDRLCCSI